MNLTILLTCLIFYLQQTHSQHIAQKCPTSFALIHLNDTGKHQEKYCCIIFLDLQGTFDTVSHDILLGK